MSSFSSKRSTVGWSNVSTSLHSQLGQRSSTSQCVGETSSHSTGYTRSRSQSGQR